MLEDPLDLAQIALKRVGIIAIELAAQHRQTILSCVGTELWLVAKYLETIDHDLEKRLQSRISKLLKHVEGMCRWKMGLSEDGYSLLEAIAQEPAGSRKYTKTRKDIQQGLLNLASDAILVENVIIPHLQGFIKKGDAGGRRLDEDEIPKTTRRIKPVDPYPSEIRIQAYRVLKEYMRVCCACDNAMQKAQGRHLAQLLLRPLSQDINFRGNDPVQFDMLVSSAPFQGRQFVHWQDVELLVLQARDKPRRLAKGVRFSVEDGNNQTALPSENWMEVLDQLEFCELIHLEANSRVRLAIQDGKLRKSGSDFVKQMVQHVPGTSLANILESYRISAKIKAVLAYIIAHSVWQYYDSDWMNRRWTSESIQFIQERSTGQSRLFPSKPYLSVDFGNEDPWSSEISAVDGEIHQFPRIRALGIMLVEIGIGRPLRRRDRQTQTESLAASMNKDLLLAIEYLKDESLWRDFDYPGYRSAVRDCLNPGTFPFTPYYQGGDKERLEDLRLRRDILYEKVVSPLKELLEGTQWIKQLTGNEIGPLETSLASAAVQPLPGQSFGYNNTEEQQPIRKSGKNSLGENERHARDWLSRMQRLNGELAVAMQRRPINSLERVRIAVLDTGCDDEHPFFFIPENEDRLKGWKDWVDESEEWQDCHGHGTYMVSLVMKIAPEADVYVARITSNPSELLNASENVAKAISWASKEWKADIISMSFGYLEEQQCISRAIREALYDRDDSIIFLAAASNDGLNEREMFPARHDAVISIHGTNAKGHFEDFNPPRNPNEMTVFGTLGLKVPGAWLSSHDNEVYKSGTSVATAIAAGIAGVLLGYAINNESEDIIMQIAKGELRKRRGMLAMFKQLGRSSNAHSCYVAPWKLERSDKERRMTFVAVLADSS